MDTGSSSEAGQPINKKMDGDAISDYISSLPPTTFAPRLPGRMSIYGQCARFQMW